MTPDDWNNCTDPQRMLDLLRKQGRLSKRKARLFAVACCRRIWPLLADERSQRTVEVAERYADAKASAEELNETFVDPHHVAMVTSATADALLYDGGITLEAASTAFASSNAAHAAASSASATPRLAEAVGVCFESAQLAASGVTPWTHTSGHAGIEREAEAQAAILRDLFRPFHTIPFNLTWRTPAALDLARMVYEGRKFDLLPLLGVALSDAGCTDAKLLDHLRGPGPFVKGDWALDLVLGKD